MRVQLSQPGLETPIRCARHNLLWDAIPGTNSRQLERVRDGIKSLGKIKKNTECAATFFKVLVPNLGHGYQSLPSRTLRPKTKLRSLYGILARQEIHELVVYNSFL